MSGMRRAKGFIAVNGARYTLFLKGLQNCARVRTSIPAGMNAPYSRRRADSAAAMVPSSR